MVGRAERLTSAQIAGNPSSHPGCPAQQRYGVLMSELSSLKGISPPSGSVNLHQSLRPPGSTASLLSTSASCRPPVFCVPGPTPSGTSVVSSRRSPSRAVAAGAARSTVWQRKNASCGTTSAGRTTPAGTGVGGAGMWRFYTEDSPGLKVGPVPVLVMSLLFVASVFMLHIWGKYTRS
nr:protein transport protein Sec61 subunit beta-like [Kogia breviceps]